MKKIHNAWAGQSGYNCFGCSPNNPHGLRMEFYEDGDDIVSIWHPTIDSQGWINVLHGGIQAALADEIASWVVFRKLQTMGVTAKMEVRYRKAISTNDKQITLRAHLLEHRRNTADIEVNIYNEAGEICNTTRCLYFVQPQDKAIAAGFIPFELEEENL